jgi:hypothetical protein
MGAPVSLKVPYVRRDWGRAEPLGLDFPMPHLDLKPTQHLTETGRGWGGAGQTSEQGDFKRHLQHQWEGLKELHCPSATRSSCGDLGGQIGLCTDCHLQPSIHRYCHSPESRKELAFSHTMYPNSMEEILACTIDQSPQKKWEARANLESQKWEAHELCGVSHDGTKWFHALPLEQTSHLDTDAALAPLWECIYILQGLRTVGMHSRPLPTPGQHTQWHSQDTGKDVVAVLCSWTPAAPCRSEEACSLGRGVWTPPHPTKCRE